MKTVILVRTLGRRCGISEYAISLGQQLDIPVVGSGADIDTDTELVIVQLEEQLYEGSVDEAIHEAEQLYAHTRGGAFVLHDYHSSYSFLAKLKWHSIIGTKQRRQGSYYLPHIGYASETASTPVDGLRLGSFGFAVPYKRFEEVIRLAGRLNLPATIFSSIPNPHNQREPACERYLADVKREARKYSGIEVVDEYLTSEQITAELRKCSHLISAMEPMSAVWGSSGSIRMMAAAGRPMVALKSYRTRGVGALLVDNLDDITIEMLENHQTPPVVEDGLQYYRTLLHWLETAKHADVGFTDFTCLTEKKQMQRLHWLRRGKLGRTVDVGIGNGFPSNFLGASAGMEERPEWAAYASVRYPHIEFHAGDAREQVLEGFATVTMGEVIEHMSMEDAKQMIAKWAATNPRRILLTTPNAGKPNYDKGCVENPEHLWFPTAELLSQMMPKGYEPTIMFSREDDFLLVELNRC